MGKLLRVLVVLLLLLGIAALILGLLLFQKRETLKGHVQDMARNVLELSGTIESEQADDLTKSDMPKMNDQLTITQLLTYKLDPTMIVDTNKPATMEAAMRMLIGKSQIQLGRLNDTRAALTQKIQELDVATNKIASLEADIVRLEDEKKQLQDNVATLEKDVAAKKTKIEELDASLEEANAKISDLTEQVAKLRDTILDKDDKIKSLNDTIEKLRPPKGVTEAPGTPGTKGRVVLVNKKWSFVVIAVNEAIGSGVELTVQRGGQLVGKVRVSDLNAQYKLAIGDILVDWEQTEVEVGDNVFY